METNGLDDLPTLVSNVETFAWTPSIMLQGGKAYAGEGVNGWKGRRIFSVSGDVRRPGVYEVPMGLPLRDLIYGDAYCQGLVRDLQLKAIAPSGPSGGFLPAKLTAKSGLPREHVKNKAWQALSTRRGFDAEAAELDVLDLELELNLFRALSPTQALGAGIVVYGEGRDMAVEAVNSMEFFRSESCGKCVPCRVGSEKAVAILEQAVLGRGKRKQLALLPQLNETMAETSICGLGQVALAPFLSVMKAFEADVRARFAEE